jgi:hypothetical protein
MKKLAIISVAVLFLGGCQTVKEYLNSPAFKAAINAAIQAEVDDLATKNPELYCGTWAKARDAYQDGRGGKDERSFYEKNYPNAKARCAKLGINI